MDGPPMAPCLAQWQVTSDAAHADRIAVLTMKERWRQQTTAPPWAVLTALAVCAIVLVLAAGPQRGVLVVVAAVALLGLLVWRSPKVLARRLRDLPAAHEPYTVTLDADGFHVVSPSVADHLRWWVFAGAAHRDGYLMLRRRGSEMVQFVPLEGLGPGVDRDGLAAEVGRLIAVDAPMAG